MALLWLIPIWLIAFGVLGISGSLRRLVDHHEKFAPAPAESAEPSEAL